MTMQPTVLLVDDEPNVLRGLQRVFWKEPYTILSASSTAEAFHFLQTQPVDIVIADQDMPDMLGTEFCGKVQQEFPATVRVILTGKSALDVVQQALDVGIISKCLTKPCNRADLNETIRQAVEQRSTQPEPQPSAPTFTPQNIHQGTEPEDAAEHHAELVQPVSDSQEIGGSIAQGASFEACLRQLCLAAQTDHEHPGIMRLRQDKEGWSISALNDISAADCRLLCAKAQDVILVRPQNGKAIRAKLDSMHFTFLIVDTERAISFNTHGEKLLVVFPVSPHERFIWLAWIDAVYFKRLKLGYKL